jgi:hypothetical protein
VSVDTIRAIARATSIAIVKERGTDVDRLAVSEWLEHDLPGLDQDFFDPAVDMTLAYVTSAEVEVYVKEHLVRDDGTVKTQKEFDAEWGSRDIIDSRL